jgi:ATP-dependent RNA helicase RhlE
LNDFSTLGLHASLLDALASQGFTAPTPIQAQAIPHLMKGRDLMGLAQTGTGKTAAFGLPLLHALMGLQRPAPKTVRALILAPTRELVNQISETLRSFTTATPVRIATVVGGASINRQVVTLARGTDVLVATPGRLLDLLERRALTLEHTRHLVLDEADQMLDLGFIHALRKIARLLPASRQTLLFSATMPKQMEELAAAYLREPVRVQVAPPGQVAERIDQGVYFVSQGDKAKLLESLLKTHPGELALVFGRTKHGSDKLAKLLESWGFSVAAIHGNKSQGQRERALAAFRAGNVQVLVATDVAARGLDIPAVRHVYNYDLPNVPENYVHRIGRTARAGKAGRAVAFCAPAELDEFRAIEKTLKEAIPVLGGTRPTSAEAGPAIKAARSSRGGGTAGKPRSPAPGGRGKPAGGKPNTAAVSAKRAPRRGGGGGGNRSRSAA